MSTYTYDSGNFPAFTYTPDDSTWTIMRELPRRPRVGPWRYKRYSKRARVLHDGDLIGVTLPYRRGRWEVLRDYLARKGWR